MGKKILNNNLKSSFWQLLIIYSIICILISLSIFSRYSLQFSILAMVIAVFGMLTLDNPKRMHTEHEFHKIMILAIFFILAMRTYPYMNNSVPLGYDPGLYRYAIETPLNEAENWVFQVHEPGFLYTVNFLRAFLPLDFILIWLFILINLFLGLSIYFCAKTFFNRDAAAFSILIFSLSLIQFKAYWFMYYRNIIGMIFMLMAFSYLRLNKKTGFVVYSVLLAWFHKPTFYIFGLSYLFYAIIRPYKKGSYDFLKFRSDAAYGLIILALSSLLYLGRFSVQITSMINPVLESMLNPGNAAGTFINLFTYQYSTLPYLALGLLGFFYTLKKKEYSILTYWMIINLIIVIFQFFFFNRFIIPMDITLILFSGIGTMLIINEKKFLGTILITILLFSALIMSTNETKASQPLVSMQELELIKSLKNTEENSYILSTSSYYSPWLLYSERKVIAPGLFDSDTHSKEEWIAFWEADDMEEIRLFMKGFPRPLYAYSGYHQENTLEKFPECFELINEGEGKVYKVKC